MEAIPEALQVPADLAGVRAARGWLRDRLQALAWPESGIHQWLSAVSELALNVIAHPRPAASQLQLRCRLDADRLQVELACDSASFADRAALLAAARPVDGQRVFASSGRGLSIVLSMFPDLEYLPAAASEDGLERFRLSRPCAPPPDA